MEIGTRVTHKKHGFEGVVVNPKSHGLDSHTVYITKGVHPYTQTKSTYLADEANLVKMDAGFASVLDDIIKDMFKVDTNTNTKVGTNGTVWITLPDKTEMEFEFYADYMQFMKDLQQQI